MTTWLFRKIPFRLTFFLALLWLTVLSSGLSAADIGGYGQGCQQDPSTAGQQLPGAGDCLQNGQNADNLTPEQRDAIQREVSRNGGLTPEAIEALRQDPEFRDVDVDEILRGRELQQMKDGGQGEWGSVDYNADGPRGRPDDVDNEANGYDGGAYGRGRVNGGEMAGADESGDYNGAPYDRNGDDGVDYGNYNKGGRESNAYGPGPGRGDYSGQNAGNPGAGRYGGNFYGNDVYGGNGFGPRKGDDGNYGNGGYAGGRPRRGPAGNYYGTGGNNKDYYDTGRHGAGPYHLSYGNGPGNGGHGATAPGPYRLEYDERADREWPGTVRPLPEKDSLFDRYMKDTPLEAGRLKPFGYDLFKWAVLRQPVDLPVASDYAVGPGDEINVFLWGRVNARYTLKVSRDGTVLFPNVGALTVSGMNFEEMRRFLTNEARKIVGADVSITMGRLRSIQVFVLGEVEKPGAYTLGAMSTLTNGLMAAGGPTSIGSLRRIDLKRGDSTVATMDFYDLLLNGDRSKDFRLQNGDLIFVPTIGPIIGVAGNVRRPAVYELAEGADLSAALRLAGGIIPTAYTQQIQVERAVNNEKRIVVDINAKEPGAASSFKLQDGDLVKVASIVDRDVNAVYLHGNVKRPGKYELKEGTRLRDVLKDESALKKESFLGYGLIKRLVPPTYEVELVPFSLKAAFSDASSAENIALKPLDVIYVFSEWFFRDRPTVTISGYVRKGGRFKLEDNMTVKDLVLLAGSLGKDASRKDFEIYRTDPDTKKVTLVKLDLGKAMDGDGANNLLLKDQDRVVVHSVRETSPGQTVTVVGQVNRPGRYEYAENMTVKDLVFAAGGLRESAYVDEAELASSSIEAGRSFAITYEKIDLAKAMAGDPANNIKVNPYGTLFVKKIPGWREENYVEIKGEVVFPGRYIVRKGDRLSSLIGRAGGFTPRAYVKGAVFTRESVRRLQQKNIDEAVSRLEKTILSTASSTIQKSLSPEDAKQQADALDQKKELLAKMKAAKAKGRISINIDEAMKERGSSFDVRLEDMDRLVIPERPAEVQVMGSVYNQTAFVYDPAASISSYIRKAGGFTEDANDDEIYILKEDGTAVSRSYDGSWGLRWDSVNHRWVTGGFMNSSLDPGDTVVVPEKLEKIAWLKEIKDITQILYQIAIATGVAMTIK